MEPNPKCTWEGEVASNRALKAFIQMQKVSFRTGFGAGQHSSDRVMQRGIRIAFDHNRDWGCASKANLSRHGRKEDGLLRWTNQLERRRLKGGLVNHPNLTGEA